MYYTKKIIILLGKSCKIMLKVNYMNAKYFINTEDGSVIVAHSEDDEWGSTYSVRFGNGPCRYAHSLRAYFWFRKSKQRKIT